MAQKVVEQFCPKTVQLLRGRLPKQPNILAKFKKNVVWKKFSKVRDRISEIIILCFKCPVGIVVSYTRFKFGSNRPRNAAAIRPRKNIKPEVERKVVVRFL